MELLDKRNAARENATSGAQLCFEEGPYLVYGKQELPAAKVKELSSKKRTLSSPVTSIGRKNRTKREAH